ncbi:MAG: TlpA disulfide reductase family protein [Bacteroidetes bacterium]|nr:TlpA disulfide reductase family protein [Bacteroidota bacterium]
MRKIAFILFITTILASCMDNKNQFTIKGSLQGVDTGMVFLQKYDSDKWVIVDSSILKQGAFSFTGKVDLPEMRNITMRQNQILVPVFVENANIEIQIFPDSLDKSIIKGSSTQEVYQQYLTMNESVNLKMDDVYKEWKKAKETNDTIGMQRADSISDSLDAMMKKQLQDFAKKNNKTVVSPYLVMRNSWQFELPELEELVNTMDTTLNGSPYLQILQKRIDILKRVAVGQIAPDFTMNDSVGNPVTLSSLKGKVLLVDFWASWCSPCRAENPSVVKAYQDFGKKGFDILGCSFDQNREKWMKAVKADNLTWTQVSDLKGWGNAAGKLYGVNSIPANVLLDKDHKIIGRNLRGEDLHNMLVEIFGPATVEKKTIRRK